MADEAQVLAEAKKLPFDERIKHKNWKVRSEAFEDIRSGCNNAFGPTDSIIREAGHLFSTGVGDSNANVMDKALDALCSWLQKSDESQAGRAASGVCSTMGTKCLKARPATVAKASDACQFFIELEQASTVVDAMITAFDDKVPKVVIAALDVLVRAVGEFGAKVVDPKFIIKALPKVYGHSNAGVRDRAKDLTVALAACTGQGLVEAALLEKMTDAMKKDVEGIIASLPSRKKRPERFTRKEQEAMAAASTEDGSLGDDNDEGVQSGGPIGDVEPMDVDADPYDYADPVDIMGPLSKEKVVVGDDSVAFWDCWESKKWNVRKAALDKMRDAAKTPRISVGDFNELIRELKKILSKDANVNCAASAADAAAAMANGLRRDFSSHAKSLTPSILERFKEKHPGMSRAAAECLRAFAKHCYNVTEVQEDLGAALGHKNPKVRLDTLRLLRDVFEDASKQQVQKAREGVLPAVVGLAGEADAGIREAAQGVLVVVALKLGGYNTIQSYVSKLDDSRCKLIEAAVAAAGPAAPASAPAGKRDALPPTAAAASRPAAHPISRSASTASSVSAASSRPGSRPTTRAGAAPAPRPKPTAAAPKANGISRGPSIEDEASLTSGKLNADEIEQRMLEMFGAAVVEELRAAAWQQRLEAMTIVSERGQEIVSANDSEVGVLVQCVATLPGWIDKNFQVLNKVFELITHLARTCDGFGKREALIAIEGLADKIHELKHRIQVTDALSAISEAVGPQFVAHHLHKRAAANKNPKVLSEALSWIALAVEEFGLVVMDLGAIISWTIEDLGSPNAPVRNQAMHVLGRCHAQVGGGLLGQLEGLKPAQVTAIEEIFRKNPKQADYQPMRKVRGKKSKRPTAPGATPDTAAADLEDEEDDDESGPVNLEDLLPRADVISALNPIIPRISSSNWKERNAALDEVEEVLKSAGNRIHPAPNDLYPVLRGRMTDTNRNLAAKALLLLGKLAEATGEPFDKQARPALSAALANLSDNKIQVRSAVIVMLDAWLTTCSADRLFPTLADTLCNPKCVIDGRTAGLAWMTKTVAAGGPGLPKALDSAVKAAVTAISDKAVAVRDAGNALLAQLVQSLGADAISAAAHQLDGPSKKLAAEVLPKALAAAAAAGPVAVAPVSSASGGGAGGVSSRPGTAGSGGSAAAGAAVGLGTRAAASAALPTASSGGYGGSDDQEAIPILAMSTAKAARARQFRVRPGRFEGLNPEEIESLEAQLSAVASPDFSAILFSKDFKKHVEAVDTLTTALPDMLEEMTASLDLILRWSVLRICDNNMQSLVRVLEMCRTILDALAETDYKLTDIEAQGFLPCLVEKWGHNQDRVRSLHRDVLRSVCAVYPTTKVLEYLTLGLGSKNVRTRIECCDEMAAIVGAEGAGPMATCRAKPVPALGALLKERDGSVRAAALGAIEAIYAHEGADALWRMMGRLEPREKDMVEEKLKRSAKASATATAAAAAAAAVGVAQRAVDNNNGAAAYAAPQSRTVFEPPQMMATPPAALPGYNGTSYGAADAGVYDDTRPLAYSRPAFTPPNTLETPTRSAPAPAPAAAAAAYHPDSYVENKAADRAAAAAALALASRNVMPTPVPSARPGYMSSNAPVAAAAAVPAAGMRPGTSPTADTYDEYELESRWNDNLRVLSTSRNLPEVIESMKQLCTDIMLVTAGRATAHSRALMGASAERLVSGVNRQLVTIFASAEQEAALTGAPPSSRGCKYALNLMLQGMSVPEIAMGLPQSTLRDSVSMLLLRLLDDGGLMQFDEGATLVKAVNVLMLKILEAGNRTYCFAALLHLLRDPPKEVTSEHAPKFYDLVVKCLIKLTKSLQSSPDGVDLSALMFSLHDFFMYLGVDEIRKRSSTDDKPLRMVKTILHEMCKLKGYGIYNYTTGIPGRNASPQPIIFAYIQLNLTSLQQSGAIAPPPEGFNSSAGNGYGNERERQREASMAAQQAEQVQAKQQAMADAQKAAVKQRLKDIMTRLVQRDKAQQEVAMVELYRLRAEHKAYVDRYIAGTSDMFRQFIDNGLAKLEATGGVPAASPAASTPEGTGGVSLTRASYSGIERPSPVSSLRSEGSASSRLSGLRDRLSSFRMSADSGVTSPQPGSVMGGVGFSRPGSATAAVGAGLPDSKLSVEQLAARMQSLRRSGQTILSRPGPDGGA